MAETSTAPTADSAPNLPSMAAHQPDVPNPVTEDEPAMSGGLQASFGPSDTAQDQSQKCMCTLLLLNLVLSQEINSQALSAPELNGKTEKRSTPTPVAEPKDIEMTDASQKADTTQVSETQTLEVNGTPASAKKQANGKRKSTGGVPEHKSKKLNKKKSSQKVTHLDAAPGEYYFARLKSYPPWPSVICDEEMLPTSLLSTRPVTTKQQDGTFKGPYADGGKRVWERTFPIMFLYTNELYVKPSFPVYLHLVPQPANH